MSKEIVFVTSIDIDQGKHEEFKVLVKEMIASSKKEPDTLSYDWFIDKSKTKCHGFERYTDSKAVVHHLNMFFEKYAKRMMELCKTTDFSIYGDVNDEVRKMLKDANPQYYHHWQGFAS